MNTQKTPAFFEAYQIRRVFEEKKQEWLFSVVDVIRALTQQPTHRGSANYWKVLKGRLKREGSQLVTNCYQLKLMSSDGKEYLTDVANAETLLRLVQSVPSPKAEPLKLWLAKVGHERLKDMADPALSLDRAREYSGTIEGGRMEKKSSGRKCGSSSSASSGGTAILPTCRRRPPKPCWHRLNGCAQADCPTPKRRADFLFRWMPGKSIIGSASLRIHRCHPQK